MRHEAGLSGIEVPLNTEYLSTEAIKNNKAGEYIEN